MARSASEMKEVVEKFIGMKTDFGFETKTFDGKVLGIDLEIRSPTNILIGSIKISDHGATGWKFGGTTGLFASSWYSLCAL